MIPHSMTAVLEKSERFSENFETEPYEVAWAHEARWFIRVLESSGDEAPLKFYPQISPDGLFWCDEGSEPLVVAGRGLYSLPLRDFGHWLRLRADFAEAETTIKALIYLALKA